VQFAGLVPLLNSLRLAGNKGPLVVLDVGLRDAQRARLEPHVAIVRIPERPEAPRLVIKAFRGSMNQQASL
jgi:hypothetical protein